MMSIWSTIYACDNAVHGAIFQNIIFVTQWWKSSLVLRHPSQRVKKVELVRIELRVDLQCLALAGFLGFLGFAGPGERPPVRPKGLRAGRVRISGVVHLHFIAIGCQADSREEHRWKYAPNQDDPREPFVRIRTSDSIAKGRHIPPPSHVEKFRCDQSWWFLNLNQGMNLIWAFYMLYTQPWYRITSQLFCHAACWMIRTTIMRHPSGVPSSLLQTGCWDWYCYQASTDGVTGRNAETGTASKWDWCSLQLRLRGYSQPADVPPPTGGGWVEKLTIAFLFLWYDRILSNRSCFQPPIESLPHSKLVLFLACSRLHRL